MSNSSISCSIGPLGLDLEGNSSMAG